MVRNNTQSFSLCSVLEKDKLNVTNYADWIRNLRIILRAEKKKDVLDIPLPKKPAFKKKGSSWKKKGKAKVANPKPNPAPKTKPGPATDNECFHCHEKGH